DRCQSYFRFELIPSMRAPLEECEAAGALRAAGAEPLVLDAQAEGLGETQTLARVASLDPDLVMIVVTFGSLEDDLSWAARIRSRLPEVPIGVRGAPCYVRAEEILRTAPAVDFCVRGEYELVFDAIARRGWRSAFGIVARDGDRI